VKKYNGLSTITRDIAMKGMLFAILMGFTILALTGCGGGGSYPQTITTSILSDPTYDGDIEQIGSSLSVTQGMSFSVQSVFAGINPATSNEFRAFLDFPLGGAAGVPSNAIIDSATLEININSIQTNYSPIPILIELVAFQPPTLIATDFDRSLQPPLAYTNILPPVSLADVGNYIVIDVTSLMAEAQFRGLTDFQVRILDDFGTSPGLIEINDTTGGSRPSLAPLLTVTYH
jgi:hypothetical protein